MLPPTINRFPLHKEEYIYQVELAFMNSFVFLVQRKDKKSKFIRHIDASGIYKRQYQNQVDFARFGMLESDRVIVPQACFNLIKVINLRDGSILRVKFNFWHRQRQCYELITFSESKYFCLFETSSQINNQTMGYLSMSGPIRLTYFMTPLSQQSIPFLELIKQNHDYNYTNVKKVNNISKLALVKFEYGRSASIILHHIKWENGQAQSCLRTQCLFNYQQYENKRGAIIVKEVWEYQPDKLLWVYQQDKRLGFLERNLEENTTHVKNIKNRQASNVYIKSMFIQNVYILKTKIAIQNSKFDFLSRLSFIQTKSGRQLQEEEEIYIKNHHFGQSGHNSSILVEWFQKQGNMIVRERTTRRSKDIFLHLLLGFEQFDDDLLQDAIELLPE